MTTTRQAIVDRAKGNPLIESLVTDNAEMLPRIRSDQQRRFTEIAGETTDRFKSVAGVSSTSGAQKRQIDLSAIAPKIERMLLFTLVTRWTSAKSRPSSRLATSSEARSSSR